MHCPVLSYMVECKRLILQILRDPVNFELACVHHRSRVHAGHCVKIFARFLPRILRPLPHNDSNFIFSRCRVLRFIEIIAKGNYLSFVEFGTEAQHAQQESLTGCYEPACSALYLRIIRWKSTSPGFPDFSLRALSISRSRRKFSADLRLASLCRLIRSTASAVASRFLLAAALPPPLPFITTSTSPAEICFRTAAKSETSAPPIGSATAVAPHHRTLFDLSCIHSPGCSAL